MKVEVVYLVAGKGSEVGGLQAERVCGTETWVESRIVATVHHVHRVVCIIGELGLVRRVVLVKAIRRCGKVIRHRSDGRMLRGID
jgi:hypothetical protein